MQVSAKRAVPILLCLLTAPAFAASPRWTLLGPDGHDARILAVAPSNPRVVYATAFAEEGLFRSLDGGATWSWPERQTLAPGDLFTQVIAVDPQRASTVYLGSGTYGIAKSTDGGVTWSPFRTFGPGRLHEVLALAIDPNRTNVLFASVFGGGIFRSNDGGMTWTRKTAGLPSAHVQAQALAIDPRKPNVILAGYPAFQAGDPTLYRSTDGGDTWAPAAVPSPVDVSVLAFSGGKSATAYALGGGDRLYKSTNDGASWSLVPLPPGLGFTALAVDPKDPRTLLAAAGDQGVFRSRDGGATWTPFDAGMAGLQAFVWTLAYNAQGTVAYAGTTNGIFQSSGGPWARTMSGFATAQVSSVALGPGNPPVLWAAAPNLGAYRSVNGGGVWRRSPLPEPVGWVKDVVADPDHPGTAWLAADASPPGLFKTVDGGRTWARLPITGTFLRLFREPGDGSLLLLREGEVLRSVDGGQTWVSSSAGIEAGDGLLDLAFDPASPQTLYVAGYKPSGDFPRPPEPRIYKSTDGGRTWARSDGGLTAQSEVDRIAVSRTGVFAAAGSTLFRSTDAGVHWEPVGAVPRYPGLAEGISDLAAAPDGTLYIGTTTGVFRTDDGVDWTMVSDGLADLQVNDLLIDPLDPGHLYAATEAGGVAVLPLNE
jgi:photosystem II stability/assembly factor-like uncharacterized protein